MPNISPVNPRKKFQWTLDFEGLEPMLAQKVTMPKLSIEAAEHGVGNVLIKTGGMVKIDDIKVTKLMFSNKNENWAYDWFRKVSDPEKGQVGLPTQYKKNGYIIWYQNDLVRVREKWQVIGCWVKEIEKDELDKTSSENVMEIVTLSCDGIIRTS